MILPNLFLGTHAHAVDHKQLQHVLGISHVLNVAGESSYRAAEGLQTLKISLRDTSSQDVSSHLAKGIAFIGTCASFVGCAC